MTRNSELPPRLPGLLLQTAETGLSTITDTSGNFTLPGLTAGDNHFEYDASSATAPNGSFYGAFIGNKDIIGNVNNIITRPIYLMRIDTAGEVQVDPANTTILTNPNLNITLTIPPNTVKDENGNDYTGMLSISEVPADFTPGSLPDELGPGLVISLQPMGLTFAQPVPITFPNFDNLTPGSHVDLWSLDHATGEFFIAGKGEVSVDGSVIDTIEGGIIASSWHTVVPDPLDNTKDPGQNETSENTKKSDCNETKSGFITQTGNYFDDHTLSGYRSLGVSRGLKFVYNSTSAFPCPIINTQTSLDPLTAVPDAISTELSVGGVDFDNETFKQGTVDLVRQSSMFDATSIETGNYLYFLYTTSHYTASTVSSSNLGNVIVNNQAKSPFGAGWTLFGLQKLQGLSDSVEQVVITEGYGTAKSFQTKFFATPTNFSGSFGQFRIVSNDFNGDGSIDLATANYFGNNPNVSILIGDGVGNFSSPISFSVSDWPASITTGDFNGDGIIDLATANDNDNVSILIGDGTGNFSLPIDFSVGTMYPFSIVSGDFNGDNVLDLATANGYWLFGDESSISVLLGDGNGNFSLPTIFSVGNSMIPVMISEDFNGDNVLDLVVANEDESSISVLLGDGNGNFSTPTSFAVGDGPFSIVPGDFDGDDLPDLAVVNGYDSTVSILLGDGNGNFSQSTNIAINRFTRSIATGDLNGDNILDLAVANEDDSSILIYSGDGTGNFLLASAHFIDGMAWSIVISDFNGDNLADLATANLDNDTVSVLLGETSIMETPLGDFSTLVKNEDSTFTRTMKDGTVINFDVNGLHTSTVDRNGNTTTYAYDLNELLTSITDPVGLVTTLQYQNGLISSVTDSAGRTTNFQHDSNGNLITIIDPDNSESSYTYDTRHLMTTETDPNGNTHTINYSFAGRFESMDFADGSMQHLSPSLQLGLVDISTGVGDSALNPDPVNVLADDIISTTTDGNGNVTTTKTDSFGAITESTDNCCLGRITSIERDEDGLPTTITRANGAITANTYDATGNLLISDDQSIGAITTLTYDPIFNQVTSITDPNGNVTTINYDATGNPIEVIDAQSNTSTQTFNAQGQLTGITDALGNTTTFTYDTNSNLATVTDPLLNVTTLTTDVPGNVIAALDANGNVTQFTYDVLNRLTSVTDANSNITNYTYDANGNLTQVTDANGNITTFVYDSMDRVVTNTDPLGNSDTFVYDGNENLISTTNRNAQIITFQYDSLNQLINKILPGSLVTTLDYDLVGNLTSIIDPDSNLAFTYDDADRLLSAATTGSPNQPDVTIDYTYDNNGNRLTMVDSITGTTNYVYDTLNRITSITNPAAQSTGFSYDILSRRTATTLANGVTTDFTYDVNSRLTNLQHVLGVTTLSDFGYSYDNVGNRTAMSTTRTGASVNSSLSYVYDNIYQLTQATNPLAALPDETFTYDPLGNRLQSDGQAVDSTIGTGNRLFG